MRTPGSQGARAALVELAPALLLGLVAWWLVRDWQGLSSWDFSEGVYALSARLTLHGAVPYRDYVLAQPPAVVYAGSAILAVHDGLLWLRAVVGLGQVVTGLLAARVVWRLTESRVATALTAPFVVLLPWNVHEHGALTPELLAGPLLLGGLLLTSRPHPHPPTRERSSPVEGDDPTRAVDPPPTRERSSLAARDDATRAVALGGCCALLVLVKLPLALPAVVLLAIADPPVRRRAAIIAGGLLLIAVIALPLSFGGNLARDMWQAQTETGTRALRDVAGYWAQAGWAVLGPLVLATIAVLGRSRLLDASLLGRGAALGLATLATLVTNLKTGTGMNIVVPVEQVLAPLAVAGAWVAVVAVRGRDRSAVARDPAAGPLGRMPVAALAAVAVSALVLPFAQTAALMHDPRDPGFFVRPGSSPAWAVVFTDSEVRATRAVARRCPPSVATSGPPFIAMVTGQRIAAGEPDQYLPFRSPVLIDVRRRIEADVPRCP